jgi:hypothetical protein
VAASAIAALLFPLMNRKRRAKMNFNAFLPYLITMALVTYLVRAIPLVCKEKD